MKNSDNFLLLDFNLELLVDCIYPIKEEISVHYFNQNYDIL